MSEFDTSAMDEDEFHHRQLCSDGACVGVLDSEGVCKECGMVGAETTTDPRLRAFKKDDVETPAPEEAVRTRPVQGETGSEDLPEDFENRRLCPDGACIGLVGADGTCGVCGAVA